MLGSHCGKVTVATSLWQSLCGKVIVAWAQWPAHGPGPWAQAHVRSLHLHVYMFRYTYMYIVTIHVKSILFVSESRSSGNTTSSDVVILWPDIFECFARQILNHIY